MSGTLAPQTPGPPSGGQSQAQTTARRQQREQRINANEERGALNRSASFAPPKPPEFRTVGVRESQQHSSKLAMEVFDLRLKLQLEQQKQEKMDKKYSTVKTALKSRGSEIQDLRREIAELRRTLEDRDRTIDGLHDELDKLELVVEDAQTVNLSYQARLEELRDGAERYQEGQNVQMQTHFPQDNSRFHSTVEDLVEGSLSRGLRQVGLGIRAIEAEPPVGGSGQVSATTPLRSPPPSESTYSPGSSPAGQSLSGSVHLPSEEDLESLYQKNIFEDSFEEPTPETLGPQGPKRSLAEIARKTEESALFFENAKSQLPSSPSDNTHQGSPEDDDTPRAPELPYVPKVEVPVTARRVPSEKLSYELIDAADAHGSDQDSQGWMPIGRPTAPVAPAKCEMPSPPCSPDLDVWMQEAQICSPQQARRRISRMVRPQTADRFLDLSPAPVQLSELLHNVHEEHAHNGEETRDITAPPRLVETRPTSPEPERASEPDPVPHEVKPSEKTACPKTPRMTALHSMFSAGFARSARRLGFGSRKSKAAIPKTGSPAERRRTAGGRSSLQAPNRAAPRDSLGLKDRSKVMGVKYQESSSSGNGTQAPSVTSRESSYGGPLFSKVSRDLSSKSSWESFREDDVPATSGSSGVSKSTPPGNGAENLRKAWRPPGKVHPGKVHRA